ncbi:MAG: ParB N-terminal domain-containing protein, partial [Syntrophobacteria bacterium]
MAREQGGRGRERANASMGGNRKKGLGKGLGALIPDADLLARTSDQFFYCGIEELSPSPYQPRQNLRDKALEQLVESVRQRGVLQPLLV